MKIIKLDDFKITTDETLRLIYEVQAYIDSTKIRLNTDIDIEYFCKNFMWTVLCPHFVILPVEKKFAIC